MLASRLVLVALHVGLFSIAAMIGHGTAMADDDWTVYGHDLENTHFAMGENDISPDNVHQLQVKWAYQTTPDIPVDPLFPLTVGDVTVPPAVVDGVLYFPDWAGNLHAVRADDGAQIWKKFFPLDYSVPGKFMFFSRTTPAVADHTLVVGGAKHLIIPTCPVGAPACVPNDGAVVAAINRNTGDLLWSTLVDTHPAAKITGSPSIFGNTVIVWDLHTRQPKKILDVPGAPLEIRCAWGSKSNYCFTTTALTSEVWLIYEDDGGEWQAKKVADIGDVSLVPFPVDISIAADDDFLWVDTWNDGKVRLYDISDPHNPKQVMEQRIGEQINMVSQSWDGDRVYFTSSLLANWDKTEGPPGDVQYFKLYSFDGKALKHEWTIDFLAEKLGSPHQMRFGAYALYGKTAPAKVAER